MGTVTHSQNVTRTSPFSQGGDVRAYDVAVIGGGASGLAAAISSARAGARTCIIERDVQAGLSILATGNGRCNVSNTRLDPRRYRHPDIVHAVFGTHPEQDIATFFESIGVLFAEEVEGRLYPITRRAESVRDTLLNACEREGVQIVTCAELTTAAHHTERGCYELELSVPAVRLAYKRGRDAKSEVRNARKALAAAESTVRMLTARRIVLACGGSSEGPCRIFGLPHRTEEPVLCPIACRLELSRSAVSSREAALEHLDGLRIETMLSLVRDGATIAFEQGEVLFRPYGISGIAAFNMSRRILAGDVIELDLFPHMSETDLVALLSKRKGALGPFAGDPNWFDGLLARPLAELTTLAVRASNQPLHDIAALLHRLRLRVYSTTEHAQAQVCRGGIPLDAIDLDTLAVGRRTDGAPLCDHTLYACGEALDMDADCGGYNLAWAWLTGMRAGTAAAQSIGAAC
ncbi:MAG: NAD(P)/FAD-dependent oxidoreductase [Coriobacteriaceae bacterium]|nr:NAD(P)/FAD-dependent oxidoreductase [Coriobacteriaceae bacterium]